MGMTRARIIRSTTAPAAAALVQPGEGVQTIGRDGAQVRAFLDAIRNGAHLQAGAGEERAFFKRLMDAIVYVHAPISDDAQTLRLVQFRHPDGFDAIPFFTSLDKAQADVLCAMSSIEIMKYPDSVVATARIMNHLGMDWTFRTDGYEATNFGLLSGKYDDTGLVGDHGRMAIFESMRKQRWGRPESLAAARRYSALAREHGLTPAQLALAFCYRNWRVASTIIGVTSVAQLDECIDAWNVQLSPELLAGIDQIRWELRDPAQ